MDDLISRGGLYEKMVALEKEAMEHCLKLARENGDPTDRMIWQAITAERTAFKHLICDEPPAKQWTPVSEGLPKEDNTYWVCTDLGYVTEISFYQGDWDELQVLHELPRFSEIVAWMPKPTPYQGEKREAKK